MSQVGQGVGRSAFGGNSGKRAKKKAQRKLQNAEDLLMETLRVLKAAGVPVANTGDIPRALRVLLPEPGLPAPVTAELLTHTAPPAPHATHAPHLTLEVHRESVRMEISSGDADGVDLDWTIPNPTVVPQPQVIPQPQAVPIAPTFAATPGGSPVPISPEEVMARFEASAEKFAQDPGHSRRGMEDRIAKWNANRDKGINPGQVAPPQAAPIAAAPVPEVLVEGGGLGVEESNRVMSRLVPPKR